MSETSPNPGPTIAGFEILEKVGQGGMGAVFRARQTSLNRIVALKILPKRLAQNPKYKERFHREARLSAKLSHPNIVNAITCGEDGGYMYLAMEFVEGQTAKRLLVERGRLEVAEGLSLLRQMAEALNCAWAQRLIHRDIKPDNIMVDKQGVAKLCDLGLARSTERLDAAITLSGEAVGTPHYMSPEQARGRDDLDVRTDIYSLGATVYHLLSGQPLFVGATSELIMTRHLTESAPALDALRPEVPEALAAILSMMLAKDPQDRYPDPTRLLDDLDALRDGRLPAALSFRGRSSCAAPARTGRGAMRPPRTEGAVRPGAPHRRRGEESVPLKPEGAKSRSVLWIGLGLVAVVAALLGSGLLRSRQAKVAAKREEPAAPVPSPRGRPEGGLAVGGAADLPRAGERDPTRPSASPAGPLDPAGPVALTPASGPELQAKAGPEPAWVGEAESRAKGKADEGSSPAAPTLPPQTPPLAAPIATVPAATALAAAAPGLDLAAWDGRLERVLAALGALDLAKARQEARPAAAEGSPVGLKPLEESLGEAVEALGVFFGSRVAALERRVGQEVRLKTAKEVLTGKLVAALDGKVRVEKPFIINGKVMGAASTSAVYAELSPETWDQLYAVPEPATPAGWSARALLYLSEKRFELAGGALERCKGQPLEPHLRRRLERASTEAREAQAAEAWTRLAARARTATAQEQAKQVLKEIEAFEAEFQATALAQGSQAERNAIKEELGKLAAGWDRQIGALFKGKIASFNRKTLDLKLEYDFSDNAQMADFEGTPWGKHGSYGCVQMGKGGIDLFHNETWNKFLWIPAYSSAEVTLSFAYKNLHWSWRSYRLAVWLSVKGSAGKSPQYLFQAEKGWLALREEGGKELRREEGVELPKEGRLEFLSKGGVLAVKLNEKKILEHNLEKPIDQRGLIVGGGGDSGFTITHLQLAGRLDQKWLSEALATLSNPEDPKAPPKNRK